jgi:drug/metabolite transporter (DMT)-like permease
LAVALAVAAALCYGASDFMGGLASRRTATLAVVLWSQAAGLVLLLGLLLWIPGRAAPSDLLWGLASGALGAGAIALLYRGLAIGTMGVVSPITAVLAAGVPVLFGVARGERPAVAALAGIVLALVAVVLVSAAPSAGAPRRDSRRLPPGIAEAVGAGFAFGGLFIGLAQTHAAAGLVPLAAARAASVALLAGVALVRPGAARPARSALPLIAAGGALDMSANILYVLAAHRGLLAIVAVLTSLYPAGTVTLAAVVLRERLGRLQWAGVAAALAGVVLLAASQ